MMYQNCNTNKTCDQGLVNDLIQYLTNYTISNQLYLQKCLGLVFAQRCEGYA